MEAASSQTARLAPRREVLDNGIVLLSNQTHTSHSLALRASFPAGASREGIDQSGLASIVARLLRRGTQRHTALQISEAVEDIGASFGVSAAMEEAGFFAKCLDRDLDTVLDVLQEVLEQPAFAQEELDKVRGEVFTELEEMEDNPRGRIDRALSEILYPAGHPYARTVSGTKESVAGITRDALRDFHQAFYTAPGIKISIAGSMDLDRVRRKLDGWFAGKPAAQAAPDWRTTPAAAAARVRIPMPHKSQVAVILAGPGIPREHPDYYSLALINHILGSLGLMGRLGAVVRDEHGIAYSVYCRSSSRLWAGEWVGGAGVSPGNEERAVELIIQEVQRARAELVSEEELADAQANLIGSLPLRMETNDGIASYLLSTEYYKQGLDYIERYPSLIRAVTREAMRDAAHAHMDPAGFSVGMAGPI